MDKKYLFLVMACIIAVMIAGCTTQQAPVPGTIPVSGTPSRGPVTTPAVSPSASSGCTQDDDCVPAQCCHPSGCTNKINKGVCNEMCTMNCAGPLDCGAGSCGCVQGTCSVVSARATLPAQENGTSIRVAASPLRYSPIMSSTPGIGLTPSATGFTAADAVFSWNASYGKFLSWNAPDYQVGQLKNTVTNHGEELYWTFTDKPSSTAAPVIITVVARDAGSGTILGTSTVTLSWDGDYAVIVQDSQ